MEKKAGQEVWYLKEPISVNNTGSMLIVKLVFSWDGRNAGTGYYTFKKTQTQVDHVYQSTNETINATIKKMLKAADEWLSEKKHEYNEANPPKGKAPDNQTSILDQEGGENNPEVEAVTAKKTSKKKQATPA